MDVIALRTYPTQGEPGVERDSCEVLTSGLVGDRRKRAPVSIAGAEDAHLRVNIVLSAPTREVEQLVGEVVTIGEVVIVLESAGSRCPGVYGVIGQPGRIRIGDRMLRAPEA